VCHRDQDVGDKQLLGEVFDPAAHVDARLAGLIRTELQIGPTQAAVPAGSQAFQNRFLCRPMGREVLDRVIPALATVDFSLGIDPPKEQLAVPLDHSTDTKTFHNCGADAYDFHYEPPSSRAGGSCANFISESRRM
jgi:hypothetical protein